VNAPAGDPKKSKDSKKLKEAAKLGQVIYDSLKQTPEESEEFALAISGSGLGPLFASDQLLRVTFPPALTKFSLRKCSLKGPHARTIANFLREARHLKQFDSGDNSYGDTTAIIIQAAVGHPSLEALQLEGCKVDDKSVQPLTELIQTSRSLTTLTVGPAHFSKASADTISKSLSSNRYLQTVSFSDACNSAAQKTTERNTLVDEVVDSIFRSPFQRQFRAKLESFKSVRGREMVVGRAAQKEKMKGTDLFAAIEQSDQRARTTETQEAKEATESFRSGRAEMIGRRPDMEDVSIILKEMPKPGALLFGLFDGHGGREAAEFASQNLPKTLAEKLSKAATPDEGFVAAFQQLQKEMKTWCVYVGTTVLLAVIEGRTLTVANTGDTRCVLSRNRKAVRLSIDHKPDLPEEAAYIQSKNGTVKDGRIDGMLAVSRALGDGFLRDAINPTPSIKRIDLTPEDRFMILACDGVWDMMSDQEACDCIAGEIDPLAAAKKLRDQAYEKGSLDNISVIVVFLAEAFADEPGADA
jgi:protein phosphatase